MCAWYLGCFLFISLFLHTYFYLMFNFYLIYSLKKRKEKKNFSQCIDGRLIFFKVLKLKLKRRKPYNRLILLSRFFFQIVLVWSLKT